MPTAMLKYVGLLLLNKLTEKSTILGIITLIIALVHYNMDATTSDLISTAISSVASLGLIYMREHSKVIVAPVVVATTEQVQELNGQATP